MLQATDKAACPAIARPAGADNPDMRLHRIRPLRIAAFVAAGATAPLAGCAVVSVAGAATGAAITVAGAATGAAISVGGAVVGTTVSVAGKVVGKTIDLAMPSPSP